MGFLAPAACCKDANQWVWVKIKSLGTTDLSLVYIVLTIQLSEVPNFDPYPNDPK